VAVLVPLTLHPCLSSFLCLGGPADRPIERPLWRAMPKVPATANELGGRWSRIPSRRRLQELARTSCGQILRCVPPSLTTCDQGVYAVLPLTRTSYKASCHITSPFVGFGKYHSGSGRRGIAGSNKFGRDWGDRGLEHWTLHLECVYSQDNDLEVR
jgi:hypothetical protein